MRDTFFQIMDITDSIMSREIFDTHEVVEKRWLEKEKEWSKSYEYAHIEIIKSEANQFFKDVRSENYVGKTGILTNSIWEFSKVCLD